MKKLIFPIVLIILLAIIVVVVGVVSSTNKQSSSSNSQKKLSKSLYDKQAKKICLMLKQASVRYKDNNSVEAVKISDSAYWDVYDNIMEIKYRSYTSPSDIFSIENSFHGYSDMLQKPFSSEQFKKINKVREEICKEMHKEAKILNDQD
ncbi:MULTISPECIES: hypothetical protein [unclassified Francisella]|uniref:hypothetical protein n=1 Tax=unclassified Francisella TaxID=2610885 RepID=UPI002E2FC328|nr:MULTISPECIES: hypothetical protein [unclassified Francisella]MED7820098.1 hypothetical protein [Francisella sp. 19S2-4]MED7830918.1 hypothetical protein [Francisella sp. 19S2-10]